jgi:site-specific DNA-methyltransferase (adenine-specific)
LGLAASGSQLVPPVAHSPSPREPSPLPAPVFRDDKHHLRIFQGDSLEILAALPESSIDLIFADPPYFLSNNGITCHAGRMVRVTSTS